MEDPRWALYGATRLFDTSLGKIGVSFSERTVLPWRKRQWLSPAEGIRFDTKQTTLLDALEQAGLPYAEAKSLARHARDEWDIAVAALPPLSEEPPPRPPIRFLASIAVVALLWVAGMLEVVRVMRRVAR